MVIGELGLDGRVKPVSGVLPGSHGQEKVSKIFPADRKCGGGPGKWKG